MNENLIRKEIWLTEDQINELKKAADKKGWSLKKYMEAVMAKQSEKISKIK